MKRAAMVLGLMAAAWLSGCGSSGQGADANDGGGTGGAGAGTGGAGGAGMICGGLLGATCGALEWCDFANDSCGAGDQQGACKPRDAAGFDCTTPVCGCDGTPYASACAAHQAGTDTASSPSCR